MENKVNSDVWMHKLELKCNRDASMTPPIRKHLLQVVRILWRCIRFDFSCIGNIVSRHHKM